MKPQYAMSKEFYEIPQVQHCEPEGKFEGVFGIRFDDKFGFASQYVDLQEELIKLFIPFSGSEKKCWDCGGNRELVLSFNLDGELVEQKDLCNMPRGHQ